MGQYVPDDCKTLGDLNLLRNLGEIKTSAACGDSAQCGLIARELMRGVAQVLHGGDGTVPTEPEEPRPEPVVFGDIPPPPPGDEA